MVAGLPTVLGLPAVTAVILEADQVSEMDILERERDREQTQYKPAEVRTLL